MNLLALRTLFTTLSGRYDLVKTVGSNTFTDNGADFIIQGGQKLLESLILTPKSKAKVLKLVEADERRIDLSNCQSVHEVWARKRVELTSGNLTVGRRYEITARDDAVFTNDGAADNNVGTQFTADAATVTLDADDRVVRIDYDDSDEGYQLELVKRVALETELIEDGAVAAQGKPYYYALDVVRDTGVTESDTTVRGVLLGPPADTYYTITVVGIFRFDKLEDDTDTNYWTDEWSILLLYAAFFTLESFYRNTAGMRDWMNAITTIIFGIDSDKVEEESHNVNQMRG